VIAANSQLDRRRGLRRQRLAVLARVVNSPPPPDGGNPPPPSDTTTPVFGSGEVSRTVFAVGRHGSTETAVSTRLRRGTTLRYTMSEDARVLVAIKRGFRGRRVRGSCVGPTRANRSRRLCARFRMFGRFPIGSVAGANRRRFPGRIGSKQVSPGRYQAVLTTTDAAGNRSERERLSSGVVAG
jgi:hypothetical protein